MRRLSLILIALTTGTLFAQPEIENTWVRVLREKLALHQAVPLREHPASVIVYLTGARERIAGAEVLRKEGEVAYLNAARYAEENLSDQPMEAVVIELKSAKINSAPITLDPVKLDPKYHIVAFENDRVRVLRTILEPHIKSPMHEHPPYVVVYLTELHTTMQLADGRTVDNPRKPGEIAWRDRMKHQTENIGSDTAVEIQVELK
jgi:hypothetical protein